MEKPNKVPDEAHHRKPNRRGRRNLGKLCEHRSKMAEAGGSTAANAGRVTRREHMDVAHVTYEV